MKAEFLNRIDQLTPNIQLKYGQMTVHQMVCHCTDFYRLVLGKKKLNEKPSLNAQEVIQLAQSKKTVPSPKELDQVKGNGTPPIEFKKDIIALKTHLEEFYTLEESYNYPSHFYFVKLNHLEWRKIASYHMNHHLRQFRV